MQKKQYGVAIIGCGLIGNKRAQALGQDGRLVACADIDKNRADGLASKYNAKVFTDWRELLKLQEVDIVIIATLHDMLAEITSECINASKHVLVEKPAARSLSELEPVMSQSEKSDVAVRVGFNHRYHRALQSAKNIIDNGDLGELMFLRARYGHGGRIGYDKEWRANSKISGGGELIDQGPHLIDLSRWFLGEFSNISGFANTYFWQMDVDDNAFLTLKTSKNQVAFLHVSCTEWKNLFSMEIYGKKGKLDISGLGGSYGVERLTFYKMLPEMGPPETVSWEFPRKDESWEQEMNDFYEDIRMNRKPTAGLKDAYEALLIINKVYKESGYDYWT